MLLSLVVIFTQSIQLSKIVERFILAMSSLAVPKDHYGPEARLSFLLKVQPLHHAVAQPEAGHSFLSLLSKRLVELTGIEPMTSCLQSRRSPN